MSWELLLPLGAWAVERFLTSRGLRKKVPDQARRIAEELLEAYKADEERRFNAMMSDALAKIAASEKHMAAALAKNDARLALEAKAARERRKK